MFIKKGKDKQGEIAYYIMLGYFIFLFCFLLLVVVLTYSIDKFDSFFDVNVDGQASQSILTNSANQSLGCQYWRKNKPYQGKAELIDLDKIVGFKDHYKTFQKYDFSFKYPDDWDFFVPYQDGGDRSAIVAFRKSFGQPLVLEVYNGDPDRFFDTYQQCIEGCFKACPKSADDFCLTYYYCSEDYSDENLTQLLTNSYINYFSSGSMPPGGGSKYILTRIFDDKTMTVEFYTESFVDTEYSFDDVFRLATYILKSAKIEN
ncbi:MAG: hypothetical protein JW816_04015 [Candidatus Buchananbacteria bacterium]|nr:hypothetical protein [Candidatus Buchananbacteria bacterium]